MVQNRQYFCHISIYIHICVYIKSNKAILYSANMRIISSMYLWNCDNYLYVSYVNLKPQVNAGRVGREICKLIASDFIQTWCRLALAGQSVDRCPSPGHMLSQLLYCQKSERYDKYTTYKYIWSIGNAVLFFCTANVNSLLIFHCNSSHISRQQIMPYYRYHIGGIRMSNLNVQCFRSHLDKLNQIHKHNITQVAHKRYNLI